MANKWRNLIGVVELKASAAETASANGAEKSDARLADFRSGVVIVTVGPVTGTSPTLDIKLQGRQTSTGAFVDLATFTQITAAGTFVISVDLFRKRLRYVSTIGGTTPSFTYSVVALAMEKKYLPDDAAVITA